MRFYKNLKDDLHCFQAALLIVLSKYFPKKEYSFKQIDRITGFKKNAATWDSKGLFWLGNQGFELVRISTFDYKRFAKEGEQYLRWFWKPEVYEWQSRESNFKQEQIAVKKLVPCIEFLHRKATVKDIENYFSKEYTIVASINPLILDRKTGYSNHSVVVTKITKSSITFHDPGLPPQVNRRVMKINFQKALHEVIAIRPKNIVRK